MRISELKDIYLNQDIYIVGSGPSTNVFPFDLLKDKICMSLNDAYKMHPFISPIALMHTSFYARAGSANTDGFHKNFERIKYPIAKASGKRRLKDEQVDWDNPYFYYYEWAHNIEDIWTLTKDTNHLFYTPEGCSLHAALQLAWIMGAKNIFTIGCDSRTLGGKHYAAYDKNKFRDNEQLDRGIQRNYDSYVYGTLIVQEFLRRKGVQVLGLSPMVGYHMIDYQYDVLRGEKSLDEVFSKVSEIGSQEEATQ